MRVQFSFRRETSSIFGQIYRPFAQVSLYSDRYKTWHTVWMIVDTGSDYTLLPSYIMGLLGISKEDMHVHRTYGIGGEENVHILHHLIVKLGKSERTIPVGFINRNNIPPLMGRHLFFETFDVVFSKKHTVRFDD